LTSHRHSTVWDGELTLFDMNFAAVGHPPEYAFVFACDRELKPGRQIRVGIPPYFEIAPRDGRPPLRHFAKTESRSANSSTL
jgi:hypothetical protein